jgi:hypothetical protein
VEGRNTRIDGQHHDDCADDGVDDCAEDCVCVVLMFMIVVMTLRLVQYQVDVLLRQAIRRGRWRSTHQTHQSRL